MQPIARRNDVQFGPYGYRVLRPAGPLRGAVLADGHELTVTRRDAGRMLRLAELTGDRTLVAFPLRDPAGRPLDLVLVDEALPFPPERWSDVRQRLGPGRLERLTPEPDLFRPAAKSRRPETRVHVLRTVVLLAATAQVRQESLKRLREGDRDLGFLRVHTG